jgi:predicted nucleotide-binding protein (sugar kinase/HSP70/actin superfamily)
VELGPTLNDMVYTPRSQLSTAWNAIIHKHIHQPCPLVNNLTAVIESSFPDENDRDYLRLRPSISLHFNRDPFQYDLQHQTRNQTRGRDVH